ncbi:MAG: transcriptional regulator [Azoarcus sp.]|jgi:nitrogen regulatory protein PII|uniref:Transcriptional regulator n=1 Tax=Parazoarcus communis TaxID=41977 RepID=A0A2U8GMR8_9RHOO|nr:transcriptional regulator [Parazoarcus communis]AWI74788.1 transcriptional regulator [Parazoarcus communis]PKO59499.1 MAG: transcriptional regulator [Betaproteobacteria bacterium HGW-Betaproteobacteria-19]PLX66888.1 MAG: transcriptional regulator [Azoarcus sp.]TVT55900.1 MAG: transcriptional regulator [Azoarcus sp. PHD]|tara:strand:+ start:25809 stop:26120 length:312 start_codon:yes stop_codon:yes gene_type:complete
MPNTHPCKLVVLITEKALEEKLADDVMHLGAHGYTVADVRGRGSHGNRAGTWDADRSIRMEVLCDANTAVTITTHVEARYFRHYAMVAFVADVGVLRPEKFAG